MTENLVGMLGDDEACQQKVPEVVDDIFNKVGNIIVPFVCEELFHWIDRDGSKGITKDEVDWLVSTVMQGPVAGFSFFFSVVDKDKNGALSAAELAAFLNKLFGIWAKVAHCVVDTLSASLKHEAVDAIVNAVFASMGEGGDSIGKEALEGAVEVFEGMNEELGRANADEDPTVQMIVANVKTLKDMAAKAAEGGMDYAVFKDFLMEKSTEQVQMLSGIMSNPPEEITDTVPEAMLAKIQEFAVLVQKAVLDGLNPESIETTAKPAFALLDADGDGTLT